MKNRDIKSPLSSKELIKLRIPYTVSFAGAMYEKKYGTSFDVSSGVILQDIITLIDSPAFLERIVKLRKKLGVIKVPVKSNVELLRVLGIKKKGTVSVTEANRWIGKIISSPENWQKFLTIWNKKVHPKRKTLESGAERILEELRRPYYLADITMQAVLLGIVGWDGNIWKLIDENSYIPKPNTAIFVNPRTTYPEVKEALKQIKDLFSRSQPQKLQNYVPNIEQYSWWYWGRVEGKKYSQIADDWAGKHQDDKQQSEVTEIDVLKGVRKYKSLLSF